MPTAETTTITTTTTTPLKTNDIFKTFRQVCLVSFFVLGSLHIMTALLTSQNLLLPLANIINKALDIPFVVTGTLYGLSQTKIDSENPAKKYYLILMGTLTILVLAIMLFIAFFIPDRI